jgi:hypothetical protein
MVLIKKLFFLEFVKIIKNLKSTKFKTFFIRSDLKLFFQIFNKFIERKKLNRVIWFSVKQNYWKINFVGVMRRQIKKCFKFAKFVRECQKLN